MGSAPLRIMTPRSIHEAPPSPSSPQHAELSLPQSPESLSQVDYLTNYDSNIISTDISDHVHPATLHLKPVTWESLANINFPSGEHFEIVDGLLLWVPMGHGTPKHQRLIRAYVDFINRSKPWRAAAGSSIEVQSITGNSNAINERGPDVVVTRRDSGSSSESSANQEKSKKRVLRTKEKPPHAVIEVTSQSTRSADISSKWLHYCKTDVTFYYIIDLHVAETSRVANVIVGTTKRLQGWKRCDNGDPDSASSSASPANQHRRMSYFKKVYTGNDIVDVGIFEDSPFTASQLLSVTFLDRKISEMHAQEQDKDNRISSLSQQNAGLSQRNAGLSQRNAGLSQQNAELRAQVDRLLAGSSSSQPVPKRSRENHKPGSPSRRQSTGSPQAPTTSSPEKKRQKDLSHNR